MEPRTILVDGYNVIRRTPGLAAAERVSLQAGRDALLASLRASYRHTPHRVVVVFDGDGERESTQPIPGLPRGQVIFTCHAELADQVIERLAAAECQQGWLVTVVSDDLEVRTSAAAAGAGMARVEHLHARFNQPDKYQRHLARHRQHVRSQWEAEDDEPSRGDRAGNPHRAPRRRRATRNEPPL
jgi:predicted RNA-binding protein with PIN domain